MTFEGFVLMVYVRQNLRDFFAFLCGLSCLPSTNCLGRTLYRLSINCLVHGIFCVWSCVWVWRIFIVFAAAFLWIQHWWFMYTFALGLLFVPWHFYFLLLWSSLKAGIKFGLCVLQLFSGHMFSLHRQQFAVHVFASSRLTISGQAQFFFFFV